MTTRKSPAPPGRCSRQDARFWRSSVQPPLQKCAFSGPPSCSKRLDDAPCGWRMVTLPPPVISNVVSPTRTAVAVMAEASPSEARNVWMTTSQPHGAIVKRACSYKPLS